MTDIAGSNAVVVDAEVGAAPTQALAALFDDGLAAPVAGDVLPPLWHWVALPSWPPAGSTGIDGHPTTSQFVRELGKPRRMFAGGRVEFLGPLIVGEHVHRREKVLSATTKTGKSGDFALVTVEVVIESTRGVAVREIQDLIYRDAAGAPANAVAPSVADVVPALLSPRDDHWEFATDPTKLLRFSAATSNGHRIHYDWPYATQVEGYPGLVVHGPLMTLALIEALRLRGLGTIASLTHRNTLPLFCGEAAHVRMVETPEGADVELTSDRGRHVQVTAQMTGGRTTGADLSRP